MNPDNSTTRFLVSDGTDAQAAAAPPAAPASLVGSRVGAYLVTKRLGEGGVGEVFKGVDVMLQREVAIKVLHHEFASDPVFVERFSREAQLHAKLSHPNVATLHAFLHEGDKQFMVMEYVAGISLDEFVRAGGPVPVGRALDIFRRALDGIEHAHRNGIVHRDIKPANIMLADNGAVKVMDFGIARAIDSHEHLTRHGHVAGTAKAMSPEQIRGGQADVRSDIYSLGIVLYTLLAGRAPFDAGSDIALMKAQLEEAPPPLRTFGVAVPPDVEAAVMRALQKDPAARFQNVTEFARALDAGDAGTQATAVRPRSPMASQPEAAQSRTAVNPALGQAQAREERTAVRATMKDAAEATAVRPLPAAAAWRKLPRLDRRSAAIALAVTALTAGAVVLVSHTMQRTPSPAEPVQAAAPHAAVPIERVAVAALPARPEPVTPKPPTPELPAPESAAAAVVPSPPPPARVATVVPRTLAITPLDSDGRFRPGEHVRVKVSASHDANVYCYLQDETHRIVRFYPNRFRKSALVPASTPLEIPGPMAFEILANAHGVPETIACFATANDPEAQLPEPVVGTDFAALPVTSLEEVRSAFARAGADTLAEARFLVRSR